MKNEGPWIAPKIATGAQLKDKSGFLQMRAISLPKGGIPSLGTDRSLTFFMCFISNKNYRNVPIASKIGR
jgi:hypothetical protein